MRRTFTVLSKLVSFTQSTKSNLLPRSIISCQRCSSAAHTDDRDVDLTPSKHSKNRIVMPVSMTRDEIRMTQGFEQEEYRDTSGRSIKYRDERNMNRKNKPNKRKNTMRHSVPVKGEILYGKFPVLMAVKAQRRKLHKLYVKDSMFEGNNSQAGILRSLVAYGKQEGIKVETVPIDFLDQLVFDPVQGLRQHQGICADVSSRHHIDMDFTKTSSVEQDEGRNKLWLLVQSVQDPNNFGAILRSAYYLGVDRVLAYNSCKLSPAVSKVSAGALELMDVYSVNDLAQFLQECRQNNWQILGTGGMREESCNSAELAAVTVDRNTVVVLGNEGKGLSDEISSFCDKLVVVSRASQRSDADSHLLDSLNVSVATGIILHDLLQKRNKTS